MQSGAGARSEFDQNSDDDTAVAHLAVYTGETNVKGLPYLVELN